MKKAALFSTLTALLVVSGCSTVPPAPPYTTKQHPEKYLFQMVSVDLPGALSEPVSMDSLSLHPEATVFEFPVVYASPGETVINDQTKPLVVNERTYKLKPSRFFGKDRIIYDQETVKIGGYSEVSFEKLEDRGALCRLKFSRKDLNGYREESIAPPIPDKDMRVSIPFFRAIGQNGKFDCLRVGTWVSMGNVSRIRNTENSSAKESGTSASTYLFVRTLPPEGVAFETSPPPIVWSSFIKTPLRQTP
jgi:hypothetical protein